jgi:hypothetical protein
MVKRIPAIFAALLLAQVTDLQGGEISNKTLVSIIHYRPAKGKVGDTIPFLWNGKHHVFYLNESRWDHIVSTDLVHWQELPSALARGVNPLGPDGEACWTGSIVEHGGTFHLFYPGKNMRDPAGDQKVMTATSTNLIQWQKQPALTFYADGKHYWSKPVNGSAEPLGYHLREESSFPAPRTAPAPSRHRAITCSNAPCFSRLARSSPSRCGSNRRTAAATG